MLLFLVRHGQTAAAGRFYGHDDVALSPRGEAQMQRVARRLARHALAAVYASDLTRATASAALVAAPHGVTVQRDPRLREMHLGCLEGLAYEAAQERYPELTARPYSSMARFRMPGGGESLADVWERVSPVLEELQTRHPDQRVAMVAHNSVNRVILGAALGLPLERVFSFTQEYSCLNIIDYRGATPVVRLLNSRSPAPPPPW